MGWCLRILSVLVVILSYLVATIIYSGPFDPILCRATMRRFGCFEVIVNGKVEKGYESVLEAFKKQFQTGFSRGSQLYVWKDGKEVVDIYGSYGEKNYNDKSLQIIFSCTKAMSVVVLAMLEERGLIDWYKPIAHYWPEFGKNGKENITITELMRHEAGLDVFHKPVPWSVFLDQDNPQDPMHKYIEESTPMWPEHTRRCYHSVTRGFIENEIVKRVDPQKRNLGQFFEDEIRIPLDIDLWIGLPDEQFSRVHPNYQWPNYYSVMNILVPYYLGIMTDESLKNFLSFMLGERHKKIREPAFIIPNDDTPILWSYEGLKAVSPSTNGVSNAHSLGKVLALLANNGELNGVRLLQPDTISRMLKVSTLPTPDAAIADVPTLFTDGGMAKNAMSIGGGDFYGWGGWGGSVVQFSRELHVGVSFMMNGMGSHLLGDPRFTCVKEELEKIWKSKI